MNTREDVAKFFAYEHLPTHLQTVSQNFRGLAMYLVDRLPPSAERTLTLRNLWDAKNYVVWCAANSETQT